MMMVIEGRPLRVRLVKQAGSRFTRAPMNLGFSPPNPQAVAPSPKFP
jgi:hypothetical protein